MANNQPDLKHETTIIFHVGFLSCADLLFTTNSLNFYCLADKIVLIDCALQYVLIFYVCCLKTWK